MISVSKLSEYLDELAAMTAPREMDDRDRKLYAQALRRLRTDAQVDALIDALRRDHEHRPRPGVVERMADDLLDPVDALPPALAQAYRPAIPAPARLAIPAPVAEASRLRARQMVQTLSQRLSAEGAWPPRKPRDDEPAAAAANEPTEGQAQDHATTAHGHA